MHGSSDAIVDHAPIYDDRIYFSASYDKMHEYVSLKFGHVESDNITRFNTLNSLIWQLPCRIKYIS